MATDTKPNLVNGKFEQCSGDILNLSGCTQVYGTISSNTGYKVSGTTILKTASSSVSSVLLGQGAGANNNGLCNVFIGYNAGCSSTGSNRLYIANSSACSLIYGDFTGNTVTLPTLKLCTTPSVGTCNDSVLVWNSTDMTIKKLPYSSGATGGGTITSANNGLNVIGSNIRLGGSLTGNTCINGAYNLSFINNRVGIGTSSPNNKLEVLDCKAGALPPVSGTTSTAQVVFGSTGENKKLYFGSDTNSPYSAWLQVSNCTDLSLNYPILLNPRGGNVGVGTINPTTKLDVNAGDNIGLRITAVGSSDNVGTGIRFAYNQNVVSNDYFIGKIDALKRNGGGGDILINAASSATAYNSNQLVVAKNGNVGIGTSTPSYGKLTINSSTIGSNDLLSLSTLDGTYNPRAIISHITTSSSQYVKFDSNYSSGTGLANWVFNSGNVGIGTSSISNKLDVNGGITITSSAFVHRSTGDLDTTGTAFTSWQDNSTGSYVERGWVGFGQGDSSIDLKNNVGAVYLSPSGGRTLVALSNGNVGIGTLTPNTKLGVSGDIQLRALNAVLRMGNGNSDDYFGSIGFNNVSNDVELKQMYNAGGIRLYTNTSCERLTILQNGNIGMGVVNPTGNKLFIDSDEGRIGNAALKILYGGATTVLGEVSALAHRNSQWNGLYINASGSSLTNAIFVEGTKPIIFNAGDIGIKTNSPGTTLDVNGIISARSYQIFCGTSGTQMLLNHGGAGWGFIGNNSTGVWSMGYTNTSSTAMDNPVIAWTNTCRVGIGTISPTARLHLRAGSASANSAPLKLTSGTNLTAPEAGAIEYDGTNLYFTPASTRKTVAFTTDANTVVGASQTTHGFSVGNVIRVSGANTFTKAQADSSANAEVVGYVTEVIDANNFKYTTGGYVTTGVPVATAGTVYYLDPSTAGALTATEPTNIGQVSKPLLVVLESGAKAIFLNYRGMLNADQSPYIVFSDTIPTGIYGEGAFWFNPTTSQLYGRYGSNWIQIISNDILPIDNASYVLSDNTINNSSTGKHGLLPKLSGSQDDALRGDGTWGAVSSGSAFWTVAQGTPTRTSNTTFTLTGDYTSIYAKGLVIKWTESSVVKVAMVSIPSTYSAPNTTVTIIGDTMASIDSASLKYSLTGVEVFIARFNVVGNISANGTDVANAYYSIQPVRVLGADLQVGTAGVTNNTTIDINKNGTTMFTTKPTLLSTVAYSSTPFSADSGTSLALNDKVTIDIDAVQSTPAIDLYVQLYLYPTRYLNLV